MAYSWKRGGVHWIGYTDSTGKRRQEPTVEKTKAKALEVAAELERKVYRAKKGLEPEIAPDFTYREGVKKYLASLSKDYESRQTLVGNFNNRILPHLGDMMTRSIFGANVIDMLNANEKEQLIERTTQAGKGKFFKLKPASDGTLIKLRMAVQGSYRYLIEELRHVTTPNPAAGKAMRERLQVPQRIPKSLTLPEIYAFLNAVPVHRRFHFCFAVAIALRRGEGLGLEWPHMHEEHRYVSIMRSHGRATTKTKRERKVPIPVWLVPIIQEARKRRTSRYVFPNGKGERQSRWTKFHNITKSALKKAGIVDGYLHMCRRKGCGHREERQDNGVTQCQKCGFTLWVEGIPRDLSFKDLRSSFGTLAQKQTKNLAFVQAVLGHGKIDTTRVFYVRNEIDDMIEVTDTMDWGPVASLGGGRATPVGSSGGRAGAVSKLSAATKENDWNGASQSE